MEGLSEGYFSILDTRGGSRDWSYQYDQNITPGLLTQYHNSTEILMMESWTIMMNDLHLFDKERYCPENSKGNAQTFIIYQYEYMYYYIKRYKNLFVTYHHSPCPTSLLFCRRITRNRKKSIAMTIINITWTLHGRYSADMTSDPIVCAAPFISWSMYCRSCSIPTNYKFQWFSTSMLVTRLCAIKKSICQFLCHIWVWL